MTVGVARFKHCVVLLLSFVMMFLLVSCSAVPAQIDYSQYFGQDRSVVLKELKKKGIKTYENEGLAGAWNLEITEDKSGHEFQTQLCFDLETDKLYGYRIAWHGTPTEDTYPLIGTLYAELVEEYGEPTQKDNGFDEKNRIEPNLDKFAEIGEKNSGGSTYGKFYLELWKDENAYYSYIRYDVQFLPDGTMNIFMDFRD